jgi:polyferredoxin
MSNDNVNHPVHYNSSNVRCDCGRQIECIDVTRHKNFNIGNSIKYLWRYELKNGIEDLKKAQWYINDEIQRMELERERS